MRAAAPPRLLQRQVIDRLVERGQPVADAVGNEVGRGRERARQRLAVARAEASRAGLLELVTAKAVIKNDSD